MIFISSARTNGCPFTETAFRSAAMNFTNQEEDPTIAPPPRASSVLRAVLHCFALTSALKIALNSVGSIPASVVVAPQSRRARIQADVGILKPGRVSWPQVELLRYRLASASPAKAARNKTREGSKGRTPIMVTENEQPLANVGKVATTTLPRRGPREPLVEQRVNARSGGASYSILIPVNTASGVSLTRGGTSET